MFRLSFLPTFSKQRKALLQVETTPALVLPETLENCISGIAQASQTPLTSLTLGMLWKNSLLVTKPILIRAAFFALLASATAALSTLAGMQILERGTSLKVGILFATIYFLMNVSSQIALFNSGRLRSWVGLGGETYLASLVAQKLIRLSARSAERQSSGNLKTLITSDVRNVGQFLDNAVRNLIPTLIAMMVIMPIIVHFGGLAGVIGMVVMLALIPLSMALNRWSTYFQDRAQGELDSLTSLVGEWVSHIRLIRYLSWEKKFETDVSQQLRQYMKPSIGLHFMACLTFGVSSSWWMVGAASVLLVSHFLGNRIEIAGFFGSLWLLTFLAGYLTHIPNTIRLYAIAAPSMKRLAKFLAEEERDQMFDPVDGPPGFGTPTSLQFEGVDYQYPDGKWVIKNFSMTFRFDRKIAVLGEIGSGKSTLLKLMTGEYPPTRGKIWVVDQNQNKSSLWSHGTYDHYRNQIAFVPQEPFVSQDRLSRNITLSDHEDHDAIMQAAYSAELEADLAALPQGIEQEIGEGGVNLSGGQRQRLNLARALYSKRKYLILDDTLSAVDLKTEANLMRTLMSGSSGFVLVTHRIQELKGVDQVIVMKDGSVAEEGCPADLARDQNSLFTRVLQAYQEAPPAEDLR